MNNNQWTRGDNVAHFDSLDKCQTCGDGIPWVNRLKRKYSGSYCGGKPRLQRFKLCAPCTARKFAMQDVPLHLRGLRQ